MSVRFIHIRKSFVEWRTHGIHLCTSNLQFNCTIKTLLGKQCSWWRIKPMLIFFFFSWCDWAGSDWEIRMQGSERQVPVVSPAGFNGTVCGSSPELGAGTRDTQQPEHKHLTQTWQLLMEVVTLESKGLTRGSTLHYYFCCWCLYVAIGVVGKPAHGLFAQTEQRQPPLHRLHLLKNARFLTLLGSFATVCSEYIKMGKSPNGDYNISTKYY